LDKGLSFPSLVDPLEMFSRGKNLLSDRPEPKREATARIQCYDNNRKIKIACPLDLTSRVVKEQFGFSSSQLKYT
jgi:hypothetical protein